MKKKITFLIVSIAVVCMTTIDLQAKETGIIRTVSGTVIDQRGAPLIGAVIILKGTDTGTISDFDGKYSINVPENAILQFSSLGFVSQEIAVEDQQVINVVMEQQMWIETATPISLTERERRKMEADNSFAFKMFKEVSNHNTFFSPFSLNMLLGMLYNGASGETRSEMAEVLGMTDFTDTEINEYYQKISQTLLSIDPLTDMLIANSLWYNDKLPIKNTFIETCKNYFDAEVRALDFGSPDAENIIDNWCAEKTRGRINSIGIRPSPNDMMYLINALYFKSEWQDQFDKEQTRQSNFRTVRQRKRVNMMAQTSDLPYSANEHFQCVELSYGNGAFSMVVLLPSENVGINQLIEHLDEVKWQNGVNSMRLQKVWLKMPRFKIEDNFLLRQPIINTGMEQMFSGGFANITDSPLWVSNIKQKTYVEVNEEGTEAAAITAAVFVGFGGKAKKVKPIRFFADRPFMFLIREKSSGTILFMGRVDEPNE